MTYTVPQDPPVGWVFCKFADIATHHSGNSKLIKGKQFKVTAPACFPVSVLLGKMFGWITGNMKASLSSSPLLVLVVENAFLPKKNGVRLQILTWSGQRPA
ncbi:MAG: hypothetical protein OXF25_01145 [Cyanobacteria bacterium MAG CAR3_bin_5]|nr:hypothetical protein [Cyanobacteria bacterium MAG CAR3_bin_5]